ncbi:MAG: hypothetical protein GXY32_05115 [Ruminococcaceae bacterium]|nr:hypothetical protein [Oscillospiraceae bacterium]
MDYRNAFETLNKAIWQYEQVHSEAYVQLMLAVREIERELGKHPDTLIRWQTKRE